jgi:hypothetical protein
VTVTGKRKKAASYDPADVTRLDFGGGYEEALSLVAGSPPAAEASPHSLHQGLPT